MRAFVAVEIPREISEKIAEIQGKLPFSEDEVKKVDPRILHITLKFLGEINENKAEEIKKILSSISFDPFFIKCKGVGIFPDEKFVRVIWVGGESDELGKIAEEINKKLAPLIPHQNNKGEKFTIHITMGRVKKKIEIKKLKDFIQKYKNFEFGSFEVNTGKIKLKKSILTPKGPIYEDV